MTKIISAKAVISAEDKGVAATFAKVAKGFDGITKTAKTFQGMKPTRALDDMARSAKALERVRPMMGWGASFQREIDRLRLSAGQLRTVQREFDRFQLKPRLGAAQYYRDLSAFKQRTIRTLAEVQEAEEKAARRRSSVGRAVKRGVAVGTAVVGVGSAAYLAERGVRSFAEKSGEAQRETVRQDLAGMTPEEQSETKNLARDISTKYPSVGPVAVEEHIRQLRSRFGDFHHTKGAIEDLVKAQVVLGNAEGADRAGHDLERLVLGLEGVGAGADPEKFRALLSSFIRAKQLFPDLQGEDFRQYLQTSKASKYGLSDDYLKFVVPTMMQHEGANQFGTQQATAFSSLVGARTTPRAAEELYNYGLIAKEDLIVDSKGKIKGFKKIKNEDELISNPYKFAKERLEPALAKKGVTLDDKENFVATITKMFSNRNAGEFFTAMLVNSGVIEKDAAMLKKIPGIEAADDVQKRDPFVGMRAMREQLFGLMQTLGGPQAEKAAGTLHSIASGIAAISEAAEKSPEVKKEASTAATLGTLGTTAAGATWLSSIIPGGTVTGMLAGAGATAAAFLSGVGFVLAWHAAGEEKKKELIAQFKQQQAEKERTGGGTRALDKLNDLDEWERGLDASGLGGVFRQSQVRKIEARRTALQPELEEYGYGPEWLPDRGYDKPLSLERVRRIVANGGGAITLQKVGDTREWERGPQASGLREAAARDRGQLGAGRDLMPPRLEELGYGPDRGSEKLSLDAIHRILGTPGAEAGPGARPAMPPVQAELHGTAEVKGEAKVTIEIPGLPARTVDVPLRGQISTNGPGSVGVSAPDAEAPRGLGHR
ncbi:MAG: hypothetical protein KIT48_12050 [Pseudolabrys sp.]|nr:hypothetical protein [Pseudolabrys sp.]